MMYSTRSVALGVGAVVALAFARPARAEDCMAAARADAARQSGKFARAVYWDGAPHCFTGCTDTLPAGGRVIFYLAAGTENTTDGQLGVVGLARDTAGPEDHKLVTSLKSCGKLFYRRFMVAAAPVAPSPPAAPGAANPAPTPNPSASSDKPVRVPGDVADAIDRYLRPSGARAFVATSSVESIATEAVQVLGQIVADRASQAAYVLIQNRLIDQLKCPKQKTEDEKKISTDKANVDKSSADKVSAGKASADEAGASKANAGKAGAEKAGADPKDDTDAATDFPATCRVIVSLRLQDIAMSPAELRAALVQDVLAWLVRSTGSSTPVTPVATLAPHASATPAIARIPEPTPAVPASAQNAVAGHDPVGALPAAATVAAQADGAIAPRSPYDLLLEGLERRLIPLLTRTVERLTGRAAETEIRGIVDTTLRKLEEKGAPRYCELKDRDRVLAAAALGFAWCAAQQPSPADCAVMQVVPTFDAKCIADQQGEKAKEGAADKPQTQAPPLTPAQLSYAESIAGHLLDAYTLKKDIGKPDVQGRLVAAADATFEIACMYAPEAGDGKQAGYQCKVNEAKHGDKLAGTEVVALARDLVLAALDRDGAGLVTVVIRGAQRALPDPNKRDELKGIRTLASIAAYAATYVSTASPDDAHKQRTALLESLTRDMTVRTDRGGDVIFGVGGALRFVAGGRIGRSVAGTRPTAIASPASLTLGFGLDYLFKDSGNGIHIETGVLDLGQYLAFDEGVNVSTPDLAAAVSPSLTVGYFWHRELPVFLGATVGYTPRYDFTSDGSKPKGAFNAGLTLGVYVPLFDFN